MTLAAGFESNLLTGLAVLIAAGSIEATWNTSGAYTTLQTGIVLGNIPQTPNRIITLTAYASDDDPALSDSAPLVQIRSRGEGADKRKADDLDAAIFNLLQHKLDLVLSTGVKVGQIHRVSGPASLGQDENSRWSVSSNYLVSAHRPSANRT
jgi:Bacteriophage minor capsid protein